MKHTAQELFDHLNEMDECPWIEAKSGSESSHSVMESVCAFCNEPGLGGGYLVVGLAEDKTTLFPQYTVSGLTDPDKIQKDFATQCAGMFNIPVRPVLVVEKFQGKTIILIWVDELPPAQKPLYFKTDGLPHGALRRIGSTDQHCTHDDMQVFYRNSSDSYDKTPVKGISISQIDENALKRYRTLREKVNSTAEELTFSDAELLQALGCVNRDKPDELNLAGLLLFGSSTAQRSTYPMLRVDYIRVPGNQWVQNPDDRFTTIDMRGPLILTLYRLIDAINADLPKGFLLPEGDIQAASTGLPMKALREALVNALMHRSYREHRPTQIIRYDNRIEIINPGFSLKSQDKLGQPGSETRNPFIAAVFHDTNLAETKGSGIRAMRKLMDQAHLVPPTFESSRENNEFTARLLLHHFLDEKDIEWLKRFESLVLNDCQKLALIFVRELGAIDNQTYRQMADCETIKASTDLRELKLYNLLVAKGKGKATYYIPGDKLTNNNAEGSVLTSGGSALNAEGGALNTGGSALNSQAGALNSKDAGKETVANNVNAPSLLNELPDDLKEEINALKERERDNEKVKRVIAKLCKLHPYTLEQIAAILDRSDKYVSRQYLKPMLESGQLKFLYPEMINHPEQAYSINTP